MDSIRQSDQVKVFLKRTNTMKRELHIHAFLASQPDSAPHVPAIYDAILLPDTDEAVLIVMPFLRQFNRPDFEDVYELMDCIMQLTQSLVILHRKNIAHSDLHGRNILMDTNGSFFKGWHIDEVEQYQPGDIFKSNQSLKRAPYIPRCLVPPKYMLADFGESSQWQEGQKSLGFGEYGSYTPPEMRADTLIDCFKADVWCFGQLISDLVSFENQAMLEERKTVMKELAVYPPLMNWIQSIKQEVNLRPTAEEVLAGLKKLLAELPDEALRESIIPKDEWQLSEIRAAMRAILRGHGNETRMFALLRAGEPNSNKNLTDGSFKDRVDAITRLYRFFANNFGRPNGVMAGITRTPA